MEGKLRGTGDGPKSDTYDDTLTELPKAPFHGMRLYFTRPLSTNWEEGDIGKVGIIRFWRVRILNLRNECTYECDWSYIQNLEGVFWLKAPLDTCPTVGGESLTTTSTATYRQEPKREIKVGDRVKWVRPEHDGWGFYDLKKDEVYTISEVYSNYLRIKELYERSGSVSTFHIDIFDLVEEEELVDLTDDIKPYEGMKFRCVDIGLGDVTIGSIYTLKGPDDEGYFNITDDKGDDGFIHEGGVWYYEDDFKWVKNG